ncbi:N-acetylneuraminate synthase [Polynucleobacter necessarius]|uniref:N-acetylneuraminate synthase n=1 Tax=Polynucleobacter necessarius TaxID=576610 RepID=UPI000FE268BE|nr:N-acetylneuraminate synthase [Polynucleobacter necessarius]
MSRVFIIAEAGVNHNGSLEIAKALVDAAAHAGADAVKFQTFKASNLVSKSAQKADYQKKTTGAVETQHAMLERLELNELAHQSIIEHCRNKKIMFLSTPFDAESIDMLKSLGMPIYKIPSGEITNLPYLRHVGRLGKEIILSTGMSSLDEIGNALDVLEREGAPRSSIAVLHATTEYPCPIEEVNLNAMLTIQKAFGVRVGYSDHTPGIEVPIAAVALGARVIEKHFTLDKSMDGPDHKASLEPDELNEMVKAIRNIEQALGDGIKRPMTSEIKNKLVVRKSLVASREIKAGEFFSAENIGAKRPGTGISPMRWDEVIGKRACRDFLLDELIEL